MKLRKEQLRVDDYRFYGTLCLIFGIVLLAIGVLLPIVTAEQEYYIFQGTYGNYVFPYLMQGIAIGVFGIVMIVISLILFREHSFRKKEQLLHVPPLPSPT